MKFTTVASLLAVASTTLAAPGRFVKRDQSLSVTDFAAVTKADGSNQIQLSVTNGALSDTCQVSW